MQVEHRHSHEGGGALAGALAGAVGVWALDRVDWFAYRHEDAAATRRTIEVRPGGEAPSHVAARRLERAAGADLSPDQHHAAGMGIHYAMGVGPGVAYGALRRRFPPLTAGRGTLYGLALFLLQDEWLNEKTGLSARQSAYPWQAHARGLVAHLVYGFVTDAVLRLFDRRSPPLRPRPF